MGNLGQINPASQFYMGVSAPDMPGGGEEDAEQLLLDELAEKLRACGCPPAQAPKYVAAVLAVFRARDAELAGEASVGQAVSDVIVRMESMTREMLAAIEEAKLPKLEARVNRIAHGVELGREESMRKLAEAYNLSPEAVSKMVDDRQNRFRLPKNHFNKSAAACERYRNANRRRVKNET